MTRILITGAAGYIGSQICWEALDRGHLIVGLDDLRTGFRSAIPKGVTLIEGDVSDRAAVGKLLRDFAPEAVIHLAGSTSVSESQQEPVKYYRNNLGSTIELADAVSATPSVRLFIFSSTAAVYGAVPNGGAVTEASNCRPISPYGSTKLFAESALREIFNGTHVALTVLRYFNVAGADPLGRTGDRKEGTGHIFRALADVACGRRPSFVVNGSDYETPDGTCIRDYIHVADLAAAHLLVIEQQARQRETFNLGYGQGYSVLEVLAAFGRVFGQPLDYSIGCRRDGDMPAMVADATLFMKAFNWAPSWGSLDLMVADFLRWEKRKSQSVDGI